MMHVRDTMIHVGGYHEHIRNVQVLNVSQRLLSVCSPT